MTQPPGPHSCVELDDRGAEVLRRRPELTAPPPGSPTVAKVSDLVVQTLYATNGRLEVTDLIVQTLRATGIGTG